MAKHYAAGYYFFDMGDCTASSTYVDNVERFLTYLYVFITPSCDVFVCAYTNRIT